MNTFWKVYYKFTLGHEAFKSRQENALAMSKYITIASRGNFSEFYNIHGEQIRGWAKKSGPRETNPLVRRYSA
jgi:hypothetical protein